MNPIPVTEKLLLRVDEAATLASVGRGTAYELIASGQWPHVKVGRGLRVPRLGLQQWIERVQEQAPAVA